MKHNKLLCRFGWHVYKPSNTEVKYIQGIICRITMRCEYCGKEERGLIRVPLPPWFRPEPPKEGMMMDDCCGCQYWDGDDGICHHPAHIGQETQNGCEHKDGGQDNGGM